MSKESQNLYWHGQNDGQKDVQSDELDQLYKSVHSNHLLRMQADKEDDLREVMDFIKVADESGKCEATIPNGLWHSYVKQKIEGSRFTIISESNNGVTIAWGGSAKLDEEDYDDGSELNR